MTVGELSELLEHLHQEDTVVIWDNDHACYFTVEGLKTGRGIVEISIVNTSIIS